MTRVKCLSLAAAALVAGCAVDPEPAPGLLALVGAHYMCDDGTRFTARFDNAADTARLDIDPDFRIDLMGQRVASGIWYAQGGWSLRGKGDAATLTRPDGRASQCRAGGSPQAVQAGAPSV